MVEFVYMENRQKGFIVPLLIIIIAALLIGGGIYYISKSKGSRNDQGTNPTASSSQSNPLNDNNKNAVIQDLKTSNAKALDSDLNSISAQQETTAVAWGSDAKVMSALMHLTNIGIQQITSGNTIATTTTTGCTTGFFASAAVKPDIQTAIALSGNSGTCFSGPSSFSVSFPLKVQHPYWCGDSNDFADAGQASPKGCK